MAVNKKKAVAPATKKAAAKQPAKAKKATAKPVAKKAATKKEAPKKAAPKKAAPAKKTASKPAVKKVAPKATPKKAAPKKAAPKAAASKTPIRKANKPIVKKVAAKAAKPDAKKTSTKLSTSKKTTPKKAAPAAKSSSAKKAVEKPAKATKAVKPVNNEETLSHQQLLKKAVKEKKVADKKKEAAKKPFVMPKTNTDKARKYNPSFTKSILDQPEEANSGPALRYSDSELVEFKELITRKLDAAKKELSYLQGLITRKDQMGGDDSDNRYMTMEDGSLSMEREQLSQMASRQITFIDHLEKALMRIENKTYGVCRVTGKLIDKARLRAVPHATLSIEAKMGIAK